MFKIASPSIVLFAVVSCLATEEKVETYSDRYDYINFEEVLTNPRIRDQYYKCFMELGPCVTADQRYFRDLIPDVFKTQCRKCTDRQKLAFDQISDFYVLKYPDQWKAVIQKFIIEPAGLMRIKNQSKQ